MSNIKDFLSGMVGSPNVRCFPSTGTYTPYRDEWAMVILVGAGGSGASTYATDSTAWTLAQGGGAGGAVWKLLRLSRGVNYTFGIGSGGAARSNSTANTAVDGQAGGDTTLAGSDIATITASGGLGGVGLYDGSIDAVETKTISLLARQSGSGGDFHYEGGSGGSLSVKNTDAGYVVHYRPFATGGGAVNIMGWADGSICDGGDITFESFSAGGNTICNATGGGGIGGHGGDLISINQTNSQRATGGGGSGGSAPEVISVNTGAGGVNSPGGAAATFKNDHIYPHSFTGAGGNGYRTATAGSVGGAGGGGGGNAGHSANGAGAPGYFGGAGGRAASTSSVPYTAAGATLGGGGGGNAFNYSSGYTIISGAGGNGIAWVYALGYYA